MAYVTGDPKVDELLAKHAEEIKRSETLAKEIAEENDRLIAKRVSKKREGGPVGVA